MDANQNDLDHDLDWLLRTCDNRSSNQAVTRPMGTTCGHLYCSPCLVARGVTPLALSCPTCNAPLPEEAMENMPTTRSTTVLLNHVPPRMRIELYLAVLETLQDHNRQHMVRSLRNLSDARGRRIQELERGMDSMMGLNAELLTQLDVYVTTINDMREQIEQLQQRGDFTTRENNELRLEMMNMRRDTGAWIGQLENDVAGRAITAPEPSETNGP